MAPSARGGELSPGTLCKEGLGWTARGVPAATGQAPIAALDAGWIFELSAADRTFERHCVEGVSRRRDTSSRRGPLFEVTDRTRRLLHSGDDRDEAYAVQRRRSHYWSAEQLRIGLGLRLSAIRTR